MVCIYLNGKIRNYPLYSMVYSVWNKCQVYCEHRGISNLVQLGMNTVRGFDPYFDIHELFSLRMENTYKFLCTKTGDRKIYRNTILCNGWGRPHWFGLKHQKGKIKWRRCHYLLPWNLKIFNFIEESTVRSCRIERISSPQGIWR